MRIYAGIVSSCLLVPCINIFVFASLVRSKPSACIVFNSAQILLISKLDGFKT